MPAPTTPSVAPVINWDKNMPAAKPARAPQKKNNPLMISAVVAMVILSASGVWRSTHQKQVVKTVKVVTVKADTPAGVRLGFMQLSYLDVPKEFASPDMLTSLTDADNHVTKAFIPAGEPMRKEMFFQSGRGLAQDLDTDERAITLKLDDDELVDHAIAPDDLVDVVVVSNKGSEKYVKTVCQAARVIMAVTKEQTLARRIGGNSNKITLAVSPNVAETISEAAEVGKIRLLLRNRLSIRHNALQGAQQKDLLPSSAFYADKETNAKILTAAPSTTSLPQLPAPPSIDWAAQASKAAGEATTPNPLQWMVQVFSGSKKETVGVPSD